MNLFELQQRANILVQKVNDYEASLTGTEIDETDTLNQHKYADLYSLRPVMKLLFGTTVDEKLNRTLENDIPLKVFASSAPANNSTFNLLSYRIEIVPITDFGSYSLYYGVDKTSPNITWSSSNGFTIPSGLIIKTPQGDFTLTNDVKVATSDSNYLGTTILVYKKSDGTFDYASAGKKIVISDTKPALPSQEEFGLYWFDTNTNQWKLLFYNDNSFTYSNATIVLIASKTVNGEFSTCYTEGLDYNSTSQSVGYKSDQHEFMNSIDMMNNYNMLQLDVKQNSVTDRDTRIKQGINYSYSSNIQDALVTESQIANIFKWNTTNDITIMNNTTSVNRQVPGIVCYYLGNNYRGVYTATIPYAPLADNINSVNYSNPAYYGAYYSTDTTTSQVGLQPGAEACRIFMPGLIYTRGLLISPQQIWQPDKKVGNDNIDKGYNWQGQAIYHELVFKNRRPGSKDNNVDFIPTLDTVADNDPQGLATRFALAQQKPYYNNRPWFNELDELYGKDATKLVNYINNNSITVPKPTYVTRINTDILIQNGGPTISENFEVSGFSDTNFFYINKEYITNDCEVVLHVTDKTYSGAPVVEHKLLDADNFLNMYRRLGYVYSFNTKVGGDSLTLWNGGLLDYWLKLVIKNGTCHYYKSPDGTAYTESAYTMSNVDIPTSNIYLGRGRATGEYWETSIYLKDCYIKRSTDTEPIYFTKQVQTQGKRFNKDLFTLTGNLTLSNDGILSNLDGTHSASLSELSYNLLEGIQNVYIYLPEITLTNTGTSGSVTSKPYNFSLNFKSDIGTHGTGFDLTLSGHDLLTISGRLRTRDNSTTKSSTEMPLYNKKCRLRMYYFGLQSTNPETKELNFSTAQLQYLNYDTNTWTNVTNFTFTGDCWLGMSELNYCNIGLYPQDKELQKLDSMDLSKFKVTANNDQITIFSPMYIPGETTMTDEEFYKNYKLDYNTWATALDKPL